MATLHCGVRASHCGDFSCCRTWALTVGFSSYGVHVELLCSVWDLPGPEIKHVSCTLVNAVKFLAIIGIFSSSVLSFILLLLQIALEQSKCT